MMNKSIDTKLRNKLIVIRIVAILFVAALFMELGLISGKGAGAYAVAIISALFVCALMDKYIVNFARR